MTEAQDEAMRTIREALLEAKGCFDAAVTEGLFDRIGESEETEPGSLTGLIQRRLLFACLPIEEALSALDTLQAMPAQPDKCPLGDDCDLTIAYMKGFEDGKRTGQPAVSDADRAEASKAVDRVAEDVKELLSGIKRVAYDDFGSIAHSAQEDLETIRETLGCMADGKEKGE